MRQQAGRTNCRLSSVQDVAINIDPGSKTTGIAVVADDEDSQRTVLASLEVKHRAFTIKPPSLSDEPTGVPAEAGYGSASHGSITGFANQERYHHQSIAYASTLCA